MQGSHDRHRAKSLTGPWEGRVVLQDKGVAQGCLIDTPDGEWHAMLFQDNGAVGRTPFLVPVRWEDGWPVLGVDGKVPMTLNIPDTVDGWGGIVASDEFERRAGEPDLPMAWQWNHNPDDRHWSIRGGKFRITTSRVDGDLTRARNTLTQRTFGPESAATIALDTAGMKDGDIAGLCALQRFYGFVGVKVTGDSKSIVMTSVDGDRPRELESVPLSRGAVQLKIRCDFRNRTDEATFYYSLDGRRWTRIGDTLDMRYTLPHFMGYRFGLFNFATRQPGGHADFDFYRIEDSIATIERGR